MRYLIVTVVMCTLLAYFPEASAQTPAQDSPGENSPAAAQPVLPH